MAKSSLVFLLFGLINASSLKINPDDTSAFLKGFLHGLQVDPSVDSKCLSGMQEISESSSLIIQDIQDFINKVPGAFTKLVSDFQDLVKQNADTMTDCNLGQLAEALSIFSGPSGYAIIMKNYFKNIFSVTRAMESFKTCGTDYSECGFYAGEIFRYLVGYSLQSVLEPNVFSYFDNDYVELVKGFLMGLQNDREINSQCLDDLAGFRDLTADIAEDIEKIVNGNLFAVQKLIKDLSLFNKDVPDFFSVCGLDGLVERLTEIAGPNGYSLLLKNYMVNKVKIMADLDVIKDCGQGYEECGEALGDAFKLIIGWSIK